MAIATTYTHARANFARFCDEASDNREIVVIRRRKAQDVALVSADELQGLLETAHLLRSSKNAHRLLTALHRAQKSKLPPLSLKQLKQELGFESSARPQKNKS